MNLSLQKLLIAAVAVISTCWTANETLANHYHSINAQASIIRGKTSALLGKVRHHYRGTPNFELLCDEVNDLKRLAEHIRRLARDKGAINYLAADLAELNDRYKHIECLFDETELAASKGHGYIKGNTAHVRVLLDAIDECICQIRTDVDAIRASFRRPVYRAPKPYQKTKQVYRQPYGGYSKYNKYQKYDYRKKYDYRGGRGGVGISIGGGSTQFHIRF